MNTKLLLWLAPAVAAVAVLVVVGFDLGSTASTVTVVGSAVAFALITAWFSVGSKTNASTHRSTNGTLRPPSTRPDKAAFDLFGPTSGAVSRGLRVRRSTSDR
jgi:hypothetical protein